MTNWPTWIVYLVCLGSRPPLRIRTWNCCGNSYWRSITSEKVYWWGTSSDVIGSSGSFFSVNWQESAHCNISFVFYSLFCPLVYLKCCLYSFQVLINGLHHFVPIDVKPKLQMVETFIKVSIIMVSSLKMSCKKWWNIFGVMWNWGLLLLYLYDTDGVHNSQKLLTCILSLSLSHTGILPTWNWICILGTDSPCKFYPYWK